MEALVSIIIPSYNSASSIRKTLESVCRQTWKNIEVIIVDDGSSDHTADVAEAYQDDRLKVIRSEHVGACRARNIGINESAGDYLQFLDADDTFEGNKIELQLNALSSRRSDHAVAYGPWWEIQGESFSDSVGFSQGRDFTDSMDWLFASMLEGFYLPPHCWLVPRSVVDAAGEWDERLLQNQDGEFFSRILESASEVIWVPGAVSYYRRENVSSVSQVKGRLYSESLLLAANLIRDRMLKHAQGDVSLRRIVSALYLRILYRMDLSDQEMVDQVWSEIRKLGLPPRSLCVGSKKFARLKSLLGWHLAFKAKSLIKR